MAVYIHQLAQWPDFRWDEAKLAPWLAEIRYREGKLIGRMEGLGFSLQNEANLSTLELDVIKSSEIEGEILNTEQVRSSIARRLGIEVGSTLKVSRDVEGVVEMVMDAVSSFREPLSNEKLFSWHCALFQTGRSGMYKINVGNWRNHLPNDPMQVVSGPMGKEKIHYEAPAAELIPNMMNQFMAWFNESSTTDPVLKAAIAHLWFVTIHPFDDGNGRIGRAILDRQLALADGTSQRFYSMSSQILKERKEYYDQLESAQKGNLDITNYLTWFLSCLDRAILNTDQVLERILSKASFWEKHTAKPLNVRQIKMINLLLDHFEGNLTSSKWAKICKCSQDTAIRDIADLTAKKILVKNEAGGRSSSYRIILKDDL